jgi:L-lactate dehydrogenase complex protein LldE
MRVALFVPCYIEQFYPEVAIATLEVLKKCGCEVDYPVNQTCCGQPMANSGFENAADSTAKLFVENFAGYDYIVAPSGSCVLHVKEHYGLLEQSEKVKHVRANVYELCEFLTDVIQIKSFPGRFPYKVGLHESCHGERGLRLSQSSELNAPYYSKIRPLLEMMEGLELVNLQRRDECCGFGGSFCISEEAVSVKMGKDRLRDHESAGAQVITGADMSCLMHLDGVIKRQHKAMRVVHISQILNS